MFVHDIIKINYTRQGYLPYYPYHLISDEEMFEGFMSYENSEEDIASYGRSGGNVICVLKAMPVECVVNLSIFQNDKEIYSLNSNNILIYLLLYNINQIILNRLFYYLFFIIIVF